MTNPIVIAHHITFTFYGCWLPNDPRGSTSKSVETPRLAELGEHHFGRRSNQLKSKEIRNFYVEASSELQYPRLECTAADRTIIARGFVDAIALHQYTCYACAIMRDHVHLLIRKHRHQAEQMIENFQNESRAQLIAVGRRTAAHPTWTKGGGKFFRHHPSGVRKTIKYIEDNPLIFQEPRQIWEFVRPYDDWPLHIGHSQRSPYVQALKKRRMYTRDDAARSKEELTR